MTSDWHQNLSEAPSSLWKSLKWSEDFSSNGVGVLKSCKMSYFMSNSSSRS